MDVYGEGGIITKLRVSSMEPSSKKLLLTQENLEIACLELNHIRDSNWIVFYKITSQT